MPLHYDRRKIVRIGVAALGIIALVYFFYSLRPVGGDGEKIFVVSKGESFTEIAKGLRREGIVRSGSVFKIAAIVRGVATELKPGSYTISPSLSALEVLGLLVSGAHREVLVTIPEGASLYEVDEILSDRGVVPKGSVIEIALRDKFEGKLFPDTYRFFADSSAEEVVKKFLENFEARAVPLLNQDPKNFETNLILASLLEKEVPDYEERRIVAGILKKRYSAGMALQVDASICYIKRQISSGSSNECYPLNPLDFKIDSPYNTYLYSGWPPGPIGSPGVSAFKAALSPKSSSYWYYLSDPRTSRTIFAETFDEHNKNRALYLGN